MFAVSLLLAINAYNWNESRLARRYAKKYRPAALPAQPEALPGDVSVVIPTISTEGFFGECLAKWLENDPKEIIVVTIPRDLILVMRHLGAINGMPNANKVRVVTVDHPNKRAQLVCGIRLATGKFLALVDDDTFPVAETTLSHLLAPFEDAHVGAVGGPQHPFIDTNADVDDRPYIIEGHQYKRDITMWEAACIRGMAGTSTYFAVRMGSDGGMWCMTGRTLLVRASIFKDDPEFESAFTSETWCGTPLNTGDDVFLTRWIQIERGWKIYYQDTPEAAVLTTIKRDIGYLYQIIRWKRSTLQMLLTHLFLAPGFWGLRRKKYPYMARKMVERLIKPAYTWICLVAWFFALRTHPTIALVIAMYHLHGYVKSYTNFLLAHPECRRHILGVIFMDHVPLLLEPYIWWTVSNDSWMTRDDSDN